MLSTFLKYCKTGDLKVNNHSHLAVLIFYREMGWGKCESRWLKHLRREKIFGLSSKDQLSEKDMEVEADRNSPDRGVSQPKPWVERRAIYLGKYKQWELLDKKVWDREYRERKLKGNSNKITESVHIMLSSLKFIW